MNVYAVPVHRPMFRQTRNLSRVPSQRTLYTKYATIIKTFLDGTTADVLRMRLKQAADASFMSIKNFLDCKQADIVLAVRDNRRLLLLVYPPNDTSPDLARWNTRLLCLVLRACNCLNVREQDDVIYLAKVYRRYCIDWRQEGGKGTISKKGRLSKRDWVNVCSAVQRMVEAVNDHRLLKEVRNFILKVDMESWTTKARQEAQCKLDSLIVEMVAANPVSRYREENMIDESKQIVKKQSSNLMSTTKHIHMPRPQSAVARLPMGKKSYRHIEMTEQKGHANILRTKTAHKAALSTYVQKKCTVMNQTTGIGNKNAVFKMSRHSADTKTKLDDENVAKVRKRCSSATERSKRTTPTLTKKRPQSATELKGTGMNKKGLPAVNTMGINTSRDTLIRREICDHSKTFRRTGPSRSERHLTLQEEHDKTIKQNETFANTRLSLGTYSGRANSFERVNLKAKINAEHSIAKIKLKSAQETKKAQTENSKQLVIHIPTGKTDIELDKKYVKNGKRFHHKTVMRKEKIKISKDDNDQAVDQHKNTDEKDKTFVEKTTELHKSILKESIKAKTSTISYLTEEQMGIDKQKVYDENMKKMANEVLVHQQIHVAARNPLLHDKEFVDEFFSFLNENHVTKKFLRAHSSESSQSWKLPNGERVNFSFFLAFVFRHIDNKDIDMVKYVVEKMLLRMKCKHSVKNKSNVSVQGNRHLTRHENSDAAENETMIADKRGRNSSKAYNLSSDKTILAGGDDGPNLRPSDSRERIEKVSNIQSRSEVREEVPKGHRSTSITDNQCWKCLQKDEAMTACVNWRNKCLCDLLVSKGVSYKEEHLSAAVKANNWVTLVNIVDFLKEIGNWNACSEESKNALYLARKHGMKQIVAFLTTEGVEDDRIVRHNVCTPCFIA